MFISGSVWGSPNGTIGNSPMVPLVANGTISITIGTNGITIGTNGIILVPLVEP